MSKPAYIPRSVRGVELRTPRLPHEPKGVEIPPPLPSCLRASVPSCLSEQSDLEATRVPFGPHKGKTLLQLLNDHPGYLLHLRDDAFTEHEAFELKVEEFCHKYQHRLERATGGSQSSTLWAASLAAFSVDSADGGVRVGAWSFDACVIEAIDLTQAESLAFEEVQKRFPAPNFQDHDASVTNIPLAALRRALKAESPGGAR